MNLKACKVCNASKAGENNSARLASLHALFNVNKMDIASEAGGLAYSYSPHSPLSTFILVAAKRAPFGSKSLAWVIAAPTL